MDEAHCVSEWSHNFRPSYMRLHSAIAGTLRARCVLALTATATRRTLTSIRSVLRMPEDAVFYGQSGRSNLTYAATLTSNLERYVEFVSLIVIASSADCDAVCSHFNTFREAISCCSQCEFVCL